MILRSFYEFNSEEQRQLHYSQDILEVIELVLSICGIVPTQRSIQNVAQPRRLQKSQKL